MNQLNVTCSTDLKKIFFCRFCISLNHFLNYHPQRQILKLLGFLCSCQLHKDYGGYHAHQFSGLKFQALENLKRMTNLHLKCHQTYTALTGHSKMLYIEISLSHSCTLSHIDDGL